jgi:2,3-bisphosphoglycerate-dependent phosphoglycerate mutase
MRLFYIRHGQSENNDLWTRTQSNLNRVPDPQLTEVGKKQAEAAAIFLEKLFRDDPLIKAQGGDIHIYCSLMERAIQTGTIISNRLTFPLKAHLDIHENGGLFTEDPLTTERKGEPGLIPEELINKYPDLVLPEGINPEGWWNRPFEERETRRIRARKVLNELINRFGNSEAIVLFISHGGFYNYFLQATLDLKEDTDVWFELNNAAITLINFSSNYKDLIYCNRFDFIPEELVT